MFEGAIKKDSGGPPGRNARLTRQLPCPLINCTSQLKTLIASSALPDGNVCPKQIVRTRGEGKIVIGSADTIMRGGYNQRAPF